MVFSRASIALILGHTGAIGYCSAVLTNVIHIVTSYFIYSRYWTFTPSVLENELPIR